MARQQATQLDRRTVLQYLCRRAASVLPTILVDWHIIQLARLPLQVHGMRFKQVPSGIDQIGYGASKRRFDNIYPPTRTDLPAQVK
jgi:hypothetical protein